MRLALMDYVIQHYFQLMATARNTRLLLLVTLPSKAPAVSSSGFGPLLTEVVLGKSSPLTTSTPSFMVGSVDMVLCFIYDLALLLSQIKILKLTFTTVSCIVSEDGELSKVS